MDVLASMYLDVGIRLHVLFFSWLAAGQEYSMEQTSCPGT